MNKIRSVVTYGKLVVWSNFSWKIKTDYILSNRLLVKLKTVLSG